MIYLGIDYGKHKIGLALSEGITASPLFVVETNSLKDSVQKINKVIGLYNITTLVVGLPDSGEAHSIAKKFIDEMKKVPHLEVITVDETLSSYNAKELMVTMKLTRKNRKTEDSFAASLLLQNYLDRVKS